MGTWGFSVLSDDTALDVHSDYLKLFNERRTPQQIREALLNEYDTNDPDEGPVIWLAIARAQWDCGQLEREVLGKAEAIIQEGTGLERWEDIGGKSLAARRRALDLFIAKLRSVNPKPRKPHEPARRKPVFDPGACISVHLPDGRFAAVLAVHNKLEADDSESETGHNVVVALEYCGQVKPDMGVFARRVWAVRQSEISTVPKPVPLVFCANRSGFAKAKEAYATVGLLPLLRKEPNEPVSYTDWKSLPDCLMWGLDRKTGE